MHAQLIIHDLKIQTKIGWSEEERQTPQTLLVSIEIRFHTLPLACTTDHLKDTLCYHQLCHQIHEFAEATSFRLIESFNQALYSFIQSLLPEKISFTLSIRKFPDIQGLQSVSFTLTDLESP